jgi:hypothetical protein
VRADRRQGAAACRRTARRHGQAAGVTIIILIYIYKFYFLAN